MIKAEDDFGIPMRYSDIPDLQTQLQHFVEEEVSGIILSIDGIRTELVYEDQLFSEDVKCHQLTVSVFIGKKSNKKYILLTK